MIPPGVERRIEGQYGINDCELHFAQGVLSIEMLRRLTITNVYCYAQLSLFAAAVLVTLLSTESTIKLDS